MPSTAAEQQGIAVVAGIIRRQGLVLIARRPDHQHMGGLWEFPGGKREPGESVHEALVRELAEELGIQVLASEPFMTVSHAYPGKRVCLEFCRVDAFRGEPHGAEGQPIRWVAPAQLAQFGFPAANAPVVQRLLDEARGAPA